MAEIDQKTAENSQKTAEKWLLDPCLAVLDATPTYPTPPAMAKALTRWFVRPHVENHRHQPIS